MGRTLLRVLVAPTLAVSMALLVGMLFLAVTGYPAVSVMRSIFVESLGEAYGIGQVLRMMTVLIFTGLAVAVAFKAGLFNIGVEGQLYIGALAVGIFGYYVKQMPRDQVEAIPWLVWTIAAILIAMVAGGLWGTVPGALKAYTGAHEVITTIMMNFIALALINYMVRPDEGSYAVPATLHTPSVPQHIRMPRLSTLIPDLKGSTANYTLFLAIGLAFFTHWLLKYSKVGFETRAVGQNPMASRLAGISPARITVLAMFASGAIAGLVGIDFVLGYKGYFEEGFSAGAGFIGIAVALLANNHPIGVIFTAFLFAVLNYGKVAAAGEVPKDIIEIVQAAVIFSVVLSNSLLGTFLNWLEKKRAAGTMTDAPIPAATETP